MVNRINLELFQQSLERATAEPEFLDHFYRGFMNTSDEVRRIFAETDMARLKRKLEASLQVLTMAASETPGMELYLGYLGRLHDRLEIDPALYGVWVDSLLNAVSVCDPQFDEDLAAAWRDVLGQAIALMHRGLSED